MKRPGKFKRFKLFKRAALAATAIVLLTGSVTYAYLQTQQVKITGNTIQTGVANLQISTTGASYGALINGFSFNDLIPGGSAMPQDGFQFYLKNGGSTQLGLKFAIINTPTNTGNVDLSKVKIILTALNSQPQTFTVQDLMAPGGAAVTSPPLLFAGNSQLFNIKVAMDADAISAGNAALSNIDFAFTGIAQ